MDKVMINQVKALKRAVRIAVCSWLTYPKSLLGSIKEGRRPTVEEAQYAQDLIDESISMIDIKFSDFLMKKEINQTAFRIVVGDSKGGHARARASLTNRKKDKVRKVARIRRKRKP